MTTAFQKKILTGLRKTMTRAQSDLARDLALFEKYPTDSFKFLVQHHKSIIDLCETEISRIEHELGRGESRQ
jgi:hypothetical protein